jgi:hypothetical protein
MIINPTPPVSCRYGAPMGRHTGPEPGSLGDRWHLRRVPLDSGGYDSGGAYWGAGLPLYWARNQDGAEVFVRLEHGDYTKALPYPHHRGDSTDRAVAKYVIRRDYDALARFYR